MTTLIYFITYVLRSAPNTPRWDVVRTRNELKSRRDVKDLEDDISGKHNELVTITGITPLGEEEGFVEDPDN